MRNSMPKHSAVYDYWKDKCITNTGIVCIEGQVPYETSIPVVYDWGEPECWCCRRLINVYDNKNYERDLEKDEKRIWDYSKVTKFLERAHIVPKALGGTYEPQNIFLLCKECHENSPDHINPIFFYKYIYDRRKYHESGAWQAEEMIAFAKLADDLNKDIFGKSNINTKNMNTHGGKLVKSTYKAEQINSLPYKTSKSIKDQASFIREMYNNVFKKEESAS